MSFVKKRNPFIAGFLTLFFGGLGFLYLGKLRWAIGYSVFPLLLFALLAWTKIIFIPFGKYGFLFLLLLLLTITIGAAVIAVRMARSQSTVPLRKYQRWYFYILYAVVFELISNYMIDHREEVLGYSSFNMPSLAMQNTLIPGDIFVSNTWKYKNHLPKRGEIIVFHYPLKPEINYLKRVIGLPNDRIKIENNKVYINGTLLNESYVDPENNLGRGLPDAMYVVPESKLFVLGDNRDHSSDSRHWGYVPKENVVGSVEYIWFSYDSTDGLRTERFGQRVK